MAADCVGKPKAREGATEGVIPWGSLLRQIVVSFKRQMRRLLGADGS